MKSLVVGAAVFLSTAAMAHDFSKTCYESAAVKAKEVLDLAKASEAKGKTTKKTVAKAAVFWNETLLCSWQLTKVEFCAVQPKLVSTLQGLEKKALDEGKGSVDSYLESLRYGLDVNQYCGL